MGQLLKRLSKFYLRISSYLVSPARPSSIVLFRVLLGLNMLFSYVAVIDNLEQKYPLTNILGVGRFIAQPEALYMVLIGLITGSVFIALGFLTQTAIAYCYLAVFLFSYSNLELLSGNDIIIHIALLLLFFMRPGQWCSVDQWLFKESRVAIRQWPVFLIQCLGATVYLVANVARIDSVFWESGLAVLSILKNDLFSIYPYFPWENYVPLMKFLAYFARYGEVAGILVPFLGRHRKWLALFLILFHLGLATLVNITGWQFFMVAIWSTALPKSWTPMRFFSSVNKGTDAPPAIGFSAARRHITITVVTVMLILNTALSWPYNKSSDQWNDFRKDLPVASNIVFTKAGAMMLFLHMTFVFKSCFIGIDVYGDKSKLLFTDLYNRCLRDESHRLHFDPTSEALFNAAFRNPGSPTLEAHLGRFLCRNARSTKSQVYGLLLAEWPSTLDNFLEKTLHRGTRPIVKYDCLRGAVLPSDKGFIGILEKDHPDIYNKLNNEGYFERTVLWKPYSEL